MGFTFNNTILTNVEVSCILKIEQWHLLFTVILFSWNCDSQYNEM